MRSNATLYLTSSALILATSLVLTGCGDNPNSNTGGNSTNNPTPNQNASGSSAVQSDGLVLAFNGFSQDSLTLNPKNLIGDLSAVAPANLYLYDVFIKNVGTVENPSTATAQSYPRTLPKSGISIQTGMTLLDPSLAMNGTSAAVTTAKTKFQMVPTTNNPVFLSIPAGLAARPEAPFFPAGTKYTGVFAEAPNKTAENHGPIISIEAGSAPVQFAAFGHHQDKTFTLRTYNEASTIDNSGKRPLLTQSTTPAIIESRFVTLTADGLSNNNISLRSLTNASLPSFGIISGKELLKSTKNVFPKLITPKNEPLFNDGNHGVFCLGGKNTFATVNLTDQTFVYPLSSKEKSTKITTLNVSEDSGFIVESGKYIDVTTLNGKETLKLIAVLKNAVTTDPVVPVVHVATLNGVSKIDVVMGIVDDPNFKLPAAGMTLLSFDNKLKTSPTVNTVDAHIAGVFYDGESKLEGSKVVLKSFTKKNAPKLASNTALRSLAHHPAAQGISSKAMNNLMAMLDPLASVNRTLGHTSSALSQHALGLQLNAPYSANSQYVTHLSNNMSLSASNALDNTIASVNLNSRYAGVDVSTSVYGVTGSNQDMAFGSSITASKLFDVQGTRYIPSVAVGYSMDALGDKTLSAQGINVNLSETKLHSVFARLMTAVNHNYNGLSATLAMGLEARHAMFSNGRAFTHYDSVSLADEAVNGVYSVVEASFSSNSTRFNITLSNFNHAQIQFGFND